MSAYGPNQCASNSRRLARLDGGYSLRFSDDGGLDVWHLGIDLMCSDPDRAREVIMEAYERLRSLTRDDPA